MKKSSIKIWLFVTVLAVVSSCDDYLDPGFQEYLEEDEVFSSYTYSLNYLRTIYSYLPSEAYGEAFMTDEARYTDPSSAYSIMNDGSWDSRTYVQGWAWGQYYAGIRRVHIFLANVDTSVFIAPSINRLTPWVNDSLQKEFKAEARFLRAFYYFELLKRFGDPTPDVNLGVPILPEKVLTVEDERDFARNTYDECVDYIVKDCDAAALVLPNRKPSAEYGRATRPAALALKSRVLLYAASPLANPSGDAEKWKLAAQAAKEVLDLPDYKLMEKSIVQSDNMLSIFTEVGSANPEVILSSAISKSNDFESTNLPPSFNGRGQTNPTQELVEAFETLLGYPITDERSGYVPTDPAYRRDKRLDYFVVSNGSSIGDKMVDSYVGGKDGLNSSITATKTGYYLRKFIDPEADIVNGQEVATHFWVHFRYAEMLLNYAEAMAGAYGMETVPGGYTMSSYDALKKIRDRAGLGTSFTYFSSLSNEEYIERIRNERRVELCFEGHRFWDVRRWKQGEKYFNAPVHGMKVTQTADTTTYEKFVVEERVFTPKMYVMPIPYYEVQKSKLLVQNKGWE